ncbi:MAG: FecR domain-containing protein, partial [Deltaproteobacteria bacterium]|nr:FecR domain-containing protein [Deltaproteobacteria bacterium]
MMKPRIQIQGMGPVVCLFLLLFAFLSITGLSAAVERGVQAPPGELPEDLKGLQISDHFLPAPTREIGVIHGLDGHMVVKHGATGKAYFAMAGDPLYEKDSLNTLAESKCRIRFTSDDVVSMGPDTTFSVDAYLDDRKEGKKTSFFSLLKGKAMFYAMRLFRYNKTDFNVKTPTAVMGIRGTKFGVHVYRIDGKKGADSGLLRVADSGNDIGSYLAQAGTGGGGQFVTLVGAADGTVLVNGQSLGPGQVYNSYTGQTVTDPGFIVVMENATGTGGAGGAGGTGGTGTPGGTGGAGAGGGANMTDTLSNITNQQTGTQTQGQGSSTGGGSQGTEPAPVILYRNGYFASMLSASYEGTEIKDVLISQSPNSFVDPETGQVVSEHRADSIIDSDYAIWSAQAFTKATTGDGAESHDISIPTTAATLSSGYTYLTYGSWGHSGYFEVGSDPTYHYAFEDHSWWLEGYATPEDRIAQQVGEIPYIGEAHGTLSHETCGTITSKDISGPFGAMVNFDNRVIEHFTFAATDGGT